MNVSKDIKIEFDEKEIAYNLFNLKGESFEMMSYYMVKEKEPYYPFIELVGLYILNTYYDDYDDEREFAKVLIRYVVLACYKIFKNIVFKEKINYFEDILKKEITFKVLSTDPKTNKNDDKLLLIYRKTKYKGQYHNINKKLNSILNSIHINLEKKTIKQQKKFSQKMQKILNTEKKYFNYKKSYRQIARSIQKLDREYDNFKIFLFKSADFLKIHNISQSFLNNYVLAHCLASAINTNATKIEDLFPIRKVAFYYLFSYPSKSHNINIIINDKHISENNTLSKLIIYNEETMLASFNYKIIKESLSFKYNGVSYLLTGNGIIKKEAFASAKELNP